MLTTSSREYLVCLLCYWSQICVLLRQWVAAIAHTQVGRYAPPTSKVKPDKVQRPRQILLKVSTLGLATEKYIQIAVVLVSVKCSPDHRESRKNVFSEHPKP